MRIARTLTATLATVTLSAACTSLDPRPDLPAQHALAAGSDTRLDQIVGDAEARHPGQSGFRLVREGPEAFAIRALSARAAGRSIDVQTYIWHTDLTGSYLALTLLEAADRGVRVRLLVDDMDARGSNRGFAALAAHPNIDVRMFNPTASREGTIAFAFEALGSAKRINRRMHNKSWIVDNRLAVAGGRNLGDEYFGASEDVNFVDLDFAVVGPIVRDASATFDRYWNSPLAYPMELLDPSAVTEPALEELRARAAPLAEQAQRSKYASELREDASVQKLVGGDWPMHWAPRFEFVADDPLKALGRGEGPNGSLVLGTLAPTIRASTTSVTIISPYFVPGPRGTEFLVGVDRAGSTVRVLTNSLAANDVALVYGGYSETREDLLEGGVELWELKPAPGSEVKASLFGSSGASLHSKALAIDSHTVFVGSYNLDPRSTSLNCEQGILVESAEIAAQLEQTFRSESSGDRAWSVTLQQGRLRWSDGTRTWDSSPEASGSRRFQAWLARILPIESQL
jgi:putative cardiolipin synthase